MGDKVGGLLQDIHKSIENEEEMTLLDLVTHIDTDNEEMEDILSEDAEDNDIINKEMIGAIGPTGYNITPEPEKGGKGKKSESDKFRELSEKGVLNWLLIQGITMEEWMAYQERRKKDTLNRKRKRQKEIEDLYE